MGGGCPTPLALVASVSHSSLRYCRAWRGTRARHHGRRGSPRVYIFKHSSPSSRRSIVLEVVEGSRGWNTRAAEEPRRRTLEGRKRRRRRTTQDRRKYLRYTRTGSWLFIPEERLSRHIYSPPLLFSYSQTHTANPKFPRTLHIYDMIVNGKTKVHLVWRIVSYSPQFFFLFFAGLSAVLLYRDSRVQSFLLREDVPADPPIIEKIHVPRKSWNIQTSVEPTYIWIAEIRSNYVCMYRVSFATIPRKPCLRESMVRDVEFSNWKKTRLWQ